MFAAGTYWGPAYAMGGRSERAADAPEQKIGEHSKGKAAFKPTSFAKSYPQAVAMVPEKVGVNQVHLDEMIQVWWTMREPLLEGIRAKISVASGPGHDSTRAAGKTPTGGGYGEV